MPLFPEIDADAIYISRSNHDEPLASYAAFSFDLDGFTWPTVEHYFQAMKFDDQAYQQKIAAAQSPEYAKKLGRSRFKRIRKDWKEKRKTMMTRGMYICAKTNPEVYEALMASGEKQFVESSAYDYFWGCGRDRRGENQYGKMLMQIRGKLLEEQREQLSKDQTGEQ